MAEELDIEAIEARANAATAGPWTWNYFGSGHGLFTVHGGSKVILLSSSDGLVTRKPGDGRLVPIDPDYPDASFLANSRADVPALIAEVRRLRKIETAATQLREEFGNDCFGDGCWNSSKRRAEGEPDDGKRCGYCELRDALAVKEPT